MAKRRYYVTFSAYLEVDEAVLAAVDDEWRAQFYDLHTREQIVEHIAYNLARGCTLTQLDGFADHKEESVKLSEFQCDEAEEREP